MEKKPKPAEPVPAAPVAETPAEAAPAIEENRARVVPAWLTRNDEALKGTVTRLPTRDEMEPSINEQLIVEYYSRF